MNLSDSIKFILGIVIVYLAIGIGYFQTISNNNNCNNNNNNNNNITNLQVDFPNLYWTSSSGSLVPELLDERGWIEVNKIQQAHIIWIRNYHKIPWNKIALTKNDSQILNYIPGTFELTRKLNLAIHLKKYETEHQLTPVQAETYLLPEQCDEFFADDSNLDQVWIRKESDLSQGEGAVVISSPRNLELIDCSSILNYKREQELDQNKQKFDINPVVLQRYMLNPLLLLGRKSEIRSYWLIASLDPLLVLYHDGTVRLNTLPFELGDWDNALVHITNTHQQHLALGDEEYEKISASLKWDLDDLAKYVTNNEKVYSSSSSSPWQTPQDFLDQHLKPMLKRAIIRTLNSTREYIIPPNVHLPNVFELLGMDFMLSADLSHGWLNEIQRGPGLSVDNPVKARVLPQMLMEMIKIVQEVLYLRKQNIIPNRLTLNTVKHFEWLIDEGTEIPFYF